LFNIVTASRKIMAGLEEKPNIGIIMSILPGTDGVVKMSKSLGNHIPLNSTPEDMYGKVMSIPDSAMGQYARLVTRWLPADVASFEHGLGSGAIHPRDAKMKLAWEVTCTYYTEAEADQAQEAFVRLFQQGTIPAEMPEFSLVAGQTVLDVLLATGLVASKSEGRRMLEQKGVKLDGEVLEKGDAGFPHAGVLQVGKRRFVRCV
jgi:tyrosyl-tRNA synthetase